MRVCREAGPWCVLTDYQKGLSFHRLLLSSTGFFRALSLIVVRALPRTILSVGYGKRVLVVPCTNVVLEGTIKIRPDVFPAILASMSSLSPQTSMYEYSYSVANP